MRNPDIVQALRDAAQEGREIIEPWQMDPNLYDDAANEIQRLRDGGCSCRPAIAVKPKISLDDALK